MPPGPRTAARRGGHTSRGRMAGFTPRREESRERVGIAGVSLVGGAGLEPAPAGCHSARSASLRGRRRLNPDPEAGLVHHCVIHQGSNEVLTARLELDGLDVHSDSGEKRCTWCRIWRPALPELGGDMERPVPSRRWDLEGLSIDINNVEGHSVRAVGLVPQDLDQRRDGERTRTRSDPCPADAHGVEQIGLNLGRVGQQQPNLHRPEAAGSSVPS